MTRNSLRNNQDQTLWEQLGQCNVTLEGPSESSAGSLPLGNGDFAANVWLEPSGDLRLLLARSDAWSELGRLLKLGGVRVRLSPNPFAEGADVRQTLHLETGEIVVEGGSFPVRLRVWCDANRPVLRLELVSPLPVSVEAILDVWRMEARALSGAEAHSAYGLEGGSEPLTEDADHVLPPQGGRLAVIHRNARSVWAGSLRRQGLGHLAQPENDPLLGRTFGFLVGGDNFTATDNFTLRSDKPARRHRLSIHARTSRADTPETWAQEARGQADKNGAVPVAPARAAHRRWWRAFWRRSWIFASGTPDAEAVTRGSVLQRYVTACAGRSAFPIKFNGSLFTAEWGVEDKPFNADFRLWGGPYWFQNTRLIYWPLLAAGDWDMMRPLFQMFQDILPLAIERTQIYFGHGGAFFPETQTFWGAYAENDYGWDREGKASGMVENPYVAGYFIGSLELLALALSLHAHTGDKAFLTDTLLPLADAVLEFWGAHWPRETNGALRLAPAQALETYHKVINPACDIAGLIHVLDGLLSLPELGEERQTRWAALRQSVPPLPLGADEQGRQFVRAADEVLEEARNSENTELYAVFPFPLYGLGRPDLDIGRETFARRPFPGTGGWRQDGAQAALLGLTDDAQRCVTANFAEPYAGARFPAFWGPNFDWIPDQDHGCAAMLALQFMLLQSVGDRLLLCPAWPARWNVDFKLRAPGRTTVQGTVRNGMMERLTITPASRTTAVEVCGDVKPLDTSESNK